MAPTQKNGGSRPISRFLNLQKAHTTRQNYTVALKQFFGWLDGEPIPRRRRSVRTANDDAAIARLDAAAVAYLTEARNGDRDPAEDLIDFIAAANAEGVAPSTIAGKRAAILGWLELSGIEVSRRQEKVIRRALPKVRTVTEERDISMAVLRSIVPLMAPPFRTATLVMLATGGRPGEVLKLRVRDVELGADPARVRFPAAVTKTKVARISFLTAEAADALAVWLPQREVYIARAERKTAGLTGNGLAGVRREGDDRLFPFDSSTYHVAWKNALKKAGLFATCEVTGRATIHPHGLRKFFRTYFGAAAGADVAEKLMGHDGYLSAAYVRLTEDDLAEAYAEFSHVLTVTPGAGAEMPRRIAELQAEVARLRAERAAEAEERAIDGEVAEMKELLEADPIVGAIIAEAVAKLKAARSA